MVVESTRFNAKIYIDYMYIEGASVLHMADDAAHFSANKVFETPTTESVLEIILTIRVNVYTELQKI